MKGTHTLRGRTKCFFRFFNVPRSRHYKKYNGSCFMYLSEILSKLQSQMCKVLLIYLSNNFVIEQYYGPWTLCPKSHICPR